MRASGHAARRGRRLFLPLVFAVLALAATSPRAEEIDLPAPPSTEPVLIRAESAQHWMQGSHEVWVLHGRCQVQQGANVAHGNEAVVWIEQSRSALPRDASELQSSSESQPNKVIAYFEGEAAVERGGDKPAKLTDTAWLGRFFTTGQIQIQVPQQSGQPSEKPAIYERALAKRMPQLTDAVRRTQYTEVPPGPVAAGEGVPPIGARRVRIYPRSNVGAEVKSETDPASGLSVHTITSGVNLIVDGLKDFGSIDVVADRVVIWTIGLDQFNNQQVQSDQVPLEIYMEGNIIFRQGPRTIYAERMYYDVRNQVGIVLEAEMLSPVEKYEGLLRLRSRVLQQTGENHFHAQDSYLTSSRFGKPGYRLQVGDIDYQDIARPMFDPATGASQVNPETGQPIVDHDRLATGSNAFVFLGDVPVFYWPYMATNLEEPSFYIRRARFKNDSVFGVQALTDWDGYQLLGIRNPPKGTDLDLSLDYMSERGLGHGGTYTYNRDGFLMWPGRTAGLLDYWGIYDHGHDNLGRDQRDLPLEKNYRYRLFWNHRQMLPRDWRLSAEVGWISDRNFLEQYYEREWDELKDETTGIELKRTTDNISYSLTADTRLNDFFTQTEWYPRLDHFWLGQPLLNDAFTWYEHSDAAYARMRTASTPEDQAQKDVFNLLPWEVTAKGERFVTTNEIDWPLQLGVVKAVPYALGQLAHWGEAIDGDDLQRAYWQAGLRASVPMWRADPSVESALWNVHGLAHKVVFDAEFSAAGANKDVDLLPLYDPINDDSIEAFERRFAFLTFGTDTTPVNPQYPARFDPRYYALRTGLPSWVTSPSAEVADDMMAMRMGMRNRWQTKRGMEGQRRITDWIVLDTNAVWFPNADRDNFGESIGLVNYDLKWYVGDRFTFVSDGLFDFFDEGQKVVTIGGFIDRPPRGNIYVGVRFFDGPINTQILSFSYNYWMSPKWVSSFGTSIALNHDGNIGQHLTVTRIGESLLVSGGFNVDASKGSVGVNFMVEPRFLTKTRLGNAGGVHIPVAGSRGLE